MFLLPHLNMGVETWLYRTLGRPRLAVVGEVLTNLFVQGPPIDWITQGVPDNQRRRWTRPSLDRVVIHGGCELMPLALYFGGIAREVVGEFNGLRDGVEIRVDHSTLLRLAVEPHDPAVANAMERLGYRPHDIQTRLAEPAAIHPWCCSSFNMDGVLAVYRHKSLDFRTTS